MPPASSSSLAVTAGLLERTPEDLDAQDGIQTVWYKVAESGELREGELGDLRFPLGVGVLCRVRYELGGRLIGEN